LDGNRIWHRYNRGNSIIDWSDHSHDVLRMFILKNNGELGARKGDQMERVKFNIIRLLDLKQTHFIKRRAECIEYYSALEDLLIYDDGSNATKKVQNILVRKCAEKYSFVKAFGLTVSSQALDLILEYIETNYSDNSAVKVNLRARPENDEMVLLTKIDASIDIQDMITFEDDKASFHNTLLPLFLSDSPT